MDPTYVFLIIVFSSVIYGNTTLLDTITVKKCCPRNEIIVEDRCESVNDESNVWIPSFSDGSSTIEPPQYDLDIGFPECKSKVVLNIYKSPKSSDRFVLLSDGKMRHYAQKDIDDHEKSSEDNIHTYDYKPGEYCVDKIILNETAPNSIDFAVICPPDGYLRRGKDFFMRRIINPIFHVFAICCFLTISIIYFVLPQLRDLVGNMITTIALSLLVSEVGDIILIFKEWNSNIGLLLADTVKYTGIMGAFFWLNSLGYYIWKSFRSRNVFIRLTDGKKYCYYSVYVWTSTFIMIGMGVFADIFLDTNKEVYAYAYLQGVIGWLGTSVFFIAIAVIILVNVFFCLSTVDVMRKISTYGRVHYKLKFHFSIFARFLIIMTANWFIFILTWLPYDEMFYIHVVMNALQAALMVYVSIVDLKRVRSLVRKACCYEKCMFHCCRPEDGTTDPAEWGDELTAMNTNTY